MTLPLEFNNNIRLRSVLAANFIDTTSLSLSCISSPRLGIQPVTCGFPLDFVFVKVYVPYWQFEFGAESFARYDECRGLEIFTIEGEFQLVCCPAEMKSPRL